MGGGLKKRVKGLVEALTETETSRKHGPVLKANFNFIEYYNPTIETSRKNKGCSKLISNHCNLVLPLGAHGLQHANIVAYHLAPQLSGKCKTKLTPGLLTCSRASLHTHLGPERSAARQARCGNPGSEQTWPPPSSDCAQSTLGTPSAYKVERGGAAVERLNSGWVVGYKVLFRKDTNGTLNAHHLPQTYLLETFFLKSQL